MLCQYINKSQYRFGQSFGTEDALIRVTKDIVTIFNISNKYMIKFLDLYKAFDTVAHHILLARLENKGIRRVRLNLFK